MHGQLKEVLYLWLITSHWISNPEATENSPPVSSSRTYSTLEDMSKTSFTQSYKKIWNFVPFKRSIGTMGFSLGWCVFSVNEWTIIVAVACLMCFATLNLFASTNDVSLSESSSLSGDDEITSVLLPVGLALILQSLSPYHSFLDPMPIWWHSIFSLGESRRCCL